MKRARTHARERESAHAHTEVRSSKAKDPHPHTQTRIDTHYGSTHVRSRLRSNCERVLTVDGSSPRARAMSTARGSLETKAQTQTQTQAQRQAKAATEEDTESWAEPKPEPEPEPDADTDTNTDTDTERYAPQLPRLAVVQPADDPAFADALNFHSRATVVQHVPGRNASNAF